ncbi:CAP domain-containing protein [Paludisphaera mucosa]|uniref:CAP domain-containing protein n=1 Tax=Paludisphaera mucosa TaxID=3030827 RepID=A0ABT6FCQ1_9BACT|nr:CAP domain-containing protein [Paludisphaera mucosa]MDG3005312.1 CAP domain-containing protein [Paludisphaera mucosa]
MPISNFAIRIPSRLLLSLVALFATGMRVEAQQYYYPTAEVAATAAPTYTYQTAPAAAAQPTYQVAQPTQYVQQPAAPQYYYQSAYAGMAAPAQPAQVQQYAAAPAAASGDPYGFVAWLNGVRASYGLGAVGYDANLSNWAAMNNSQQAARGLGHHVMGPARRQNSAMGGFPGIENMWMASPAHRAALLDPTITFVGIAGAGAWWTFNAN